MKTQCGFIFQYGVDIDIRYCDRGTCIKKNLEVTLIFIWRTLARPTMFQPLISQEREDKQTAVSSLNDSPFLVTYRELANLRFLNQKMEESMLNYS